MAAAGVLRRMTMREDWAATVARSEGARMLIPLLSIKDDQTRWHAQAALWNIAGEVENHAVLRRTRRARVPHEDRVSRRRPRINSNCCSRMRRRDDAREGDDAEEEDGGDENEN